MSGQDGDDDPKWRYVSRNITHSLSVLACDRKSIRFDEPKTKSNFNIDTWFAYYADSMLR